MMEIHRKSTPGAGNNGIVQAMTNTWQKALLYNAGIVIMDCTGYGPDFQRN